VQGCSAVAVSNRSHNGMRDVGGHSLTPSRPACWPRSREGEGQVLEPAGTRGVCAGANASLRRTAKTIDRTWAAVLGP